MTSLLLSGSETKMDSFLMVALVHRECWRRLGWGKGILIQRISGACCQPGFWARMNVSKLESNYLYSQLAKEARSFLWGHLTDWQKEVFLEYFLCDFLADGGGGRLYLSHGMERSRPYCWAPIIKFHTPWFCLINLGQSSELWVKGSEVFIHFHEWVVWAHPSTYLDSQHLEKIQGNCAPVNFIKRHKPCCTFGWSFEKEYTQSQKIVLIYWCLLWVLKFHK